MRVKPKDAAAVKDRMRPVFKLVDQAQDDYALAGTFVDDGAWGSAARCLRSAADKLEQAQSAKLALMNEQIDRKPK